MVYMSKKQREKNLLLNITIGILIISILTLIGSHNIYENDTDGMISDINSSNKDAVQASKNRAENYENNPTGTVRDEAINRVLTTIGKDKEDINNIYNEDGTVDSESVKTVKQFRTLNDAEVYLGFYLGLHNRLESIDAYELVSVSNIGEGAWVQALYQSDDFDKNTDFTLKVSKTSPLEVLLGAFNLENGYKDIDILDIDGQEVTILSKTNFKDEANLSYFSTKNGKKYVLNCGGGMIKENMILILTELVHNLMGMDDWVW